MPVIVSLVLAMMLMIAPLPDWMLPFRPDWLTLTLIYWAMWMPRTWSVGTACLAGLVLDVAQGTLLGQHALALSIVVYVTVRFHLLMRVFPMSQLSATVFALLALYQFILFWVNGVVGIPVAAVSYWGPVISGALLWPLITMLLYSVRMRAR